MCMVPNPKAHHCSLAAMRIFSVSNSQFVSQVHNTLDIYFSFCREKTMSMTKLIRLAGSSRTRGVFDTLHTQGLALNELQIYSSNLIVVCRDIIISVDS
jgi:hypothetical protein